MATSCLRFIASGGFGAVYKYDSKKGAGVVARKVFNINMERAAKHERAVLTEIGRHYNIVAYKGFGVISAGFCQDLIEGAPFIDFEYIDGPMLWDLCFKDDAAHDWLTTLPRLCDIIRGLLAAVNHVHAQGFLHLDLKPGNVMVVKSKAGSGVRLKPILIDFGISQQITDSQQLQDHRGTDGYQPPEWWAGAVPTQAYDVWGLGVIFYELLYGQRAVPINETLKRMKNRGNGIRDSNNNNIMNDANKLEITINDTDTAERKERLNWQKKYSSAMEKASSEIPLLPRKPNRFQFIVPNDVHALVLHMLGQVKERPSIKEVLASPMFRSIQEGTYEQERHARHRALQKVEELQREKKEIEKQCCKLQEELRHMQQYNSMQATTPKVKKVDMAVGTEGEDEFNAAIRQRKNLERIIQDNEKAIEECYTQLEVAEDKLVNEHKERVKLEEDFANMKAALEKDLQQEKSTCKRTLAELQQYKDINDGLEKKIQEAEASHQAELQKANAKIKALQEQLATQQHVAPGIVNWSSSFPQQTLPPPPPPPPQQQLQQEQPPDTVDLLVQAFDIADIDLSAALRTSEASKRPTNQSVGATNTKRLRTEPDLQHLSSAEYQSIMNAGINMSKLPNVDAAWKALDWAYGLYQKNAGDIDKPPNALKLVYVDHSKESSGLQTTSPFEEWLMLVLHHLGASNEGLKKRAIFVKLTGRSGNAYSTLLKRFKK